MTMNTDYQSALSNGAAAAARIHHKLGSRQNVERNIGWIDVFAAIAQLDLPLLLRPLDGLLGAYFCVPEPGILVTTKRPLAIQRFTAAHELGHHCLEHQASIDDEITLRESGGPGLTQSTLREVEANAFAAGFLLPKWLVDNQIKVQGWRVKHLADPIVVYQLSLRMGASFEATWRALRNYNLISAEIACHMQHTELRQVKKTLLDGYEPPDYRRNVWLLTKHDQGTWIRASRKDFFVIRLKEHPASGYVWDEEELIQRGFAIVGDIREEGSTDEIGASVYRRIVAHPEWRANEELSMGERRPWSPRQQFNHFGIRCDLAGQELPGASRVARRQRLNAV